MAEPDIPWARVAAFVRQHTHDVRNGLNTIDLETAILGDYVTDNDGRASLERVHRQVRTLAEQLRSLCGVFQDPAPVAAPIAARDLFLIWREKHAALPRPPEVRWVDELRDEQVRADVEIMATVFRELLLNAAAFSPNEMATITARSQGDSVVFELEEANKAEVDTSTWGEPFATTRRGAYGLGLCAAQRLVEASGATLTRRYIAEDSKLLTRIILTKV